VAKDVQGYAERVACLSAHLAEVESGYSDGVVDDDLVIVPARMTAHGAIEILKIGAIIF